MAPNSFLIVWADEDVEEEGLHADFKLSAGGESVILSYPNGEIIDTMTFGAQVENIGYARIPNGTGNFVSQFPTFNSNNENLGVEDNEADTLKAFPNPVISVLNLSGSTTILQVEVFNLLGQRVISGEYSGTDVQISLDGLEAGSYLVKVSGADGTTMLKVLKK
jgi:hypothetical protein